MKSDGLMKECRLAEALDALQAQVRNDPSSPENRAFLYQLLCVLGQWDRALTQINVLGDISPKDLLMVEYYRNAIRCEALREQVFAGARTPLLLGEPAEWLGMMVRALSLVAEGNAAAAADLRDRAYEAAPAVPGEINGERFEWIADTDQRLGPVLEVMIQGKYYWTALDNVSALTIEPPQSLRDVVWAQAEFTWANGGKAVGLIPVRYPGTTETGPDEARLARRTDYRDLDGGLSIGVGQRMWATDSGEYPILETTSITLGAGPDGDAAAAEASEPARG